MSTKYFNFNNEQDLTPVQYNDETGVVTFSLEGETMDFNSLQEFAEFYATARNVVPENLKNWVMTQEGNQFAFVLAAGTAGISEREVQDMAIALLNLGFTAEEIAVAIASAKGIPLDSVIVQIEQDVAQPEVGYDTIRHMLSAMTPITVDILTNMYHQPESLTQAVFSDQTLRRPETISKAVIQKYGSLKGASMETIIAYNIVTKVVAESDRLLDLYPNLPLTTILNILLGRAIPGDDLVARNDYQKAVQEATLADREVLLTIVATSDNVPISIHAHGNNDAETKSMLADSHAVVLHDEEHFTIVNNY